MKHKTLTNGEDRRADDASDGPSHESHGPADQSSVLRPRDRPHRLFVSVER